MAKEGKRHQGGGDDVCRYAVCQSAGCSAGHLPESYHLLASAFSHIGGVGRHHALYDLQVGYDVEALPNKGMKAQFRFMRHLAPGLSSLLLSWATAVFSAGSVTSLRFCR